jgi:hypothetical protein
MSQPPRSERIGRHAASPLWSRVRSGAFFGAVFGTLMIGVGVARALIVLLFAGGVGISPLRDLGFGLFYVTGFAVAGAMLGALWPLRATRVGAYALGYLGASIVCTVCGVIVMQLEHSRDPRAFAFVVGILTLTFGTAAGHQIRSAH